MAGRPRIYGADTPTREVRVVLSKELLADLDAIGSRLGMSASQYVRSLVHQHVAKVGKASA